MARIDLDAARAARREALGESPVVVFGGEEFTLPVEMPFQVLDILSGMEASSETSDMMRVLRVLLGDRFDEFMELGPSSEDLKVLLREVLKDYGLTSGEPQASE